MENTSHADVADEYNISVVSNLIKPQGYISRKRITKKELAVAHWCVMENCEEVKYYMDAHKEQYYSTAPNSDDNMRTKHFLNYFKKWVCF